MTLEPFKLRRPFQCDKCGKDLEMDRRAYMSRDSSVYCSKKCGQQAGH